ncbi:MAG: hypothetical protein P8X64_11530 [Anaerolineales bacterium]|jgi:hypothetical protein
MVAVDAARATHAMQDEGPHKLGPLPPQPGNVQREGWLESIR